MSQPFMLEASSIAKAFNISVSAVYQLAKREELPIKAYKFGRKVRFRRADLEEFLGASLNEILDEPVLLEDVGQ